MFFCLLRFNSHYKGLGWAAMGKTGPNNARHVVWAKGELFFFLFHVLLNLTNVFCLLSFYLHYKGMERVGMGGDGKNGPKRHKTCRLGQIYRIGEKGAQTTKHSFVVCALGMCISFFCLLINTNDL